MKVTKEDLLSCSVHLSEDERAVVLLDQTKLPNKTEYLTLTEAEEIYNAIKVLAVRGAPAIGICAGYAMYVLAQRAEASIYEELCEKLHRDGDYLISSRPTAVNLSWAVNRMYAVLDGAAGKSVDEVIALLREEAYAIQIEDIEMCKSIAEYGLSLLKPGDTFLTHCNAGPLATSKYGTAIGPAFLAK